MIQVETMQQQQPPQQQGPHVSPSPSFRLKSFSSSETLAEIAARVIEELRWDPHNSISDDDHLLQPWENENDDDNHAQHEEDVINGNNKIDNDNNSEDEDEDDEDEFEFTFYPREPNTSPVSADDVFFNGQIKPTYPLFDRTLLLNNNIPNDTVSVINKTNQHDDAASDEIKRRRPPLRKLMSEERETASCSTSTSEADESLDLEGIPEGTYCVWTPHSVGVKEREKKISSTGSVSKRWKLRNLVLRSQSEGKEKVDKRSNRVANEVEKVGSGDGNGGALMTVVKDGEQGKRKSLLPNKQEFWGTKLAEEEKSGGACTCKRWWVTGLDAKRWLVTVACGTVMVVVVGDGGNGGFSSTAFPPLSRLFDVSSIAILCLAA
ncbi:hypothetical protein RIF29_10260 [Crotalaria pallida]|uniref:Uncharacterized protein n=1 Tax=Crotalaria pallida TaxID=3830 RepID=A0AAN9FSQ6_CROPI